MAVSAGTPAIEDRSRILRDRWLWLGVAFYAAIYFGLGFVRYAGHRNFVDLGIFTQTVASAFGCFCNSVEGSHWAVHFSPVLYVAGALFRLWPSALLLIALAAIAGALTAPPIAAVVARRSDIRSARLAALVVLLYPPLGGAIFNDFHENALAPAAVAWLLWAFDGRRIGWTIVFALLTLAIKEDQALFVFVAALVGAVAYRSDRVRVVLASGIAIASVLVLALFFSVVQPHAAHAAHWAPQRFYAWTHADWSALPSFGIVARIGFVLLTFVPLLFIPFRTWAVLVMLVPLAEVLASRMSTTYTVGSHYAGAWAGWVLYAFAAGIIAIAASSVRRVHVALYWCIGLCVAEFAAADPLHPGYFLRGSSFAGAELDAYLQRLPPAIDLATQEEAYTHLAAGDPNVTVFPESSQQPVTACFLLTDKAFAQSPRLVEYEPAIAHLTADGTYRVAQREGPITLYKRASACRSEASAAHQPQTAAILLPRSSRSRTAPPKATSAQR